MKERGKKERNIKRVEGKLCWRTDTRVCWWLMTRNQSRVRD